MILDMIIAHKRTEVALAKERTPLEAVREEAEEAAQRGGPRRFRAALLARPGVSLIAEVKKASPSKGVIRADFDPVLLARWYEEGGAEALSVLTDERFFQGGLHHFDAVRRSTSLPMLRKEFIIDPYQVYEAKAHGADAVLLIAAALGPAMLEELYALAHSLEMDALVEVHTEEELDAALDLGADLIGINNRDLKTFHTTLDVTRRLVPKIPAGPAVVSESGISRREDVEALDAVGVHAVLVGEALSRERDVVAKVRELSGKGVPETAASERGGTRGDNPGRSGAAWSG